MSKLIITTVGTSVLGHLVRAQNSGLNQLLKNIENKPYSDKAKYQAEWDVLHEQALSRLRNLDLTQENHLNKSSAEIKSLVKMGTTSDDSVYLLATDTVDGMLCGEVLSVFLPKGFGCSTRPESLEPVSGLQVTDGRRFRREGVRNFLDTVINLLENYGRRYGCVLNPTGGFKAIVPYTTLLGMLYSVPIHYIFEETQELIRLPSLPLTSDYTLMEKYESKFEELEKDIPHLNEFRKGIAQGDWENMESLVEIDRDVVMLNEIGLLLWRRYCSTFVKLHVSEHAGEFLEKNQCESWLLKVSDPQLRNGPKHYHDLGEFTKRTQLKCFKSTGTENYRIFWNESGGELHICEIFDDEDKYQRYINSSNPRRFEDYSFEVIKIAKG